MDVREVVSAASSAAGGTQNDRCPRCGETLGGLPPIHAASLGRAAIRRCLRCNARFAVGPTADQLLFTCEQCGIPFLTGQLLPHVEHRCAECGQGRLPPDLPDAGLAAATEAEVREALSTRWRLLTSDALQLYLDRIAHHVAERTEGAPPRAEVLLVDDPNLRTLALPSGALLMSVGSLLFLKDEAELAFVLGHEIAHAASGDAAVRLVRLGFRGSAKGPESHDGSAWADAALDLVRLGYGRRRERDADARALEATLDLGYDPESVVRYLKRLHLRMEHADAMLAELAISHPAPMDRIRRVDKALYGRVKKERVLKVNREVFRRVAGRELLQSSLVGRVWKERRSDPLLPSPARTRGRAIRVVTIAAGIVVLATLALGVGLLLTR